MVMMMPATNGRRRRFPRIGENSREGVSGRIVEACEVLQQAFDSIGGQHEGTTKDHNGQAVACEGFTWERRGR